MSLLLQEKVTPKGSDVVLPQYEFAQVLVQSAVPTAHHISQN